VCSRTILDPTSGGVLMKSMAWSPDQEGNCGQGPREVYARIRPVEVAMTTVQYGPFRPRAVTAASSLPSGVSAMLFGKT